MKASGGIQHFLQLLCWWAHSLAAARHQLLPRQRGCMEATGAGFIWLMLCVCFWGWSNLSHSKDQTTVWSLESRADVAVAWGADGRKAAKLKQNTEKQLFSMNSWDILGIKLGVCLSFMLTVYEVSMLLVQHRCGGENPFHKPHLSVRMGLHVPVSVQHQETRSESTPGVCISHVLCRNQPPV